MADDVANDLRVLLLAQEISVPIIVGYLPATPDDVIMIRQLEGLGDMETLEGIVYEQPRAQVLIRSDSYDLAISRARVARKALRRANIGILGTRYLRIVPMGSIGDLGKDDHKPPRRLVSFNVQIMKEEL
jgi:hypothetical protein